MTNRSMTMFKNKINNLTLVTYRWSLDGAGELSNVGLLPEAEQAEAELALGEEVTLGLGLPTLVDVGVGGAGCFMCRDGTLPGFK